MTAMLKKLFGWIGVMGMLTACTLPIIGDIDPFDAKPIRQDDHIEIPSAVTSGNFSRPDAGTTVGVDGAFARLTSVVARNMQDSLLNAGAPSFDHVIVVTLLIQGRDIDVTSLSPRVINIAGRDPYKASTIVRFSDTLDELTFFSRNPWGGEGYRAIVPVHRLTAGYTLSFPVLMHGKLEPALIKVMAVNHRTLPAGTLAPYQFKGTLPAPDTSAPLTP